MGLPGALNYLTVQRPGVAGGDLHVDEFSYKAALPLEVDEPAAVCAAGEVIFVAPGLAVNEHAQRLTLVFLVLLTGDAVRYLSEPVEMLLLLLARVGIGHGRRRGADTL